MRGWRDWLFAVILVANAGCGSEPAEAPAEPSAGETVTTESGSASVETPAEVAAGAKFQVGWTGPDGQNDYVTVVDKGAPQGTYTNFVYTREGSPVELTAAETPGEYEVRYVAGETKETLVQATLTVTEVTAALEAPAEVGEGASFEVSWSGPDNHNDYLTVVEKGAAQGTYASHKYTREGSPLELRAAEAAGEYEVRYVMNQSKRVLASRPLRVTPVEATLTAPADAMVESSIEVVWTGPDNHNDYVTIVESGAPQGTYGDYTYTRDGSPVEVKAPKTPGRYEVRYVMDQSKRILARAPVTVKPLSATLEAPARVQAGESFEVVWTGPNNQRDFIAIAQPAAAATSYESRAYSRAGQPAQLFAPSSPGSYELRYVLEKGNQILKTVPIEVTAPE